MAARTLNKRVRRDVSNLAGLRVALYCRVSDDSNDTEKSVTDQEGAGRGWVARNGCVLADVYKDNDRSASRFATREREDFIRLVDDITAGRIDVLWMWELSRSQRRLGVFADLRDLCREMNVLWVVAGRVYDLSNYMDVAALGFFAVHGEVEAELISERVRRGQASLAAAGLPNGQTPYGYRRVYDPHTKRFLRQEKDTTVRTAIGEDGRTRRYSPAKVVAEIFRRVSEGDPLIVIERDLNARGIPSPKGKQWLRGMIRNIALNAAYAGKRTVAGEIVGEGQWDGIVDEELYWTCVRLLKDPARKTTKPGRAVHLLSYIAHCDECGDPLAAFQMRRGGPSGVFWYGCLRKRCTAIMESMLDEYVERVVVAWLSRKDVFTALNRRHDDRQVAEARAEAERLRTELAEYKQLASQGKIKATSYVEIEDGLTKAIADAEAQAAALSLPPVLRGRIGPKAAATWRDLDLPVKREIIRLVADIRLRKADGSRGLKPGRIAWYWLLGDQDQ